MKDSLALLESLRSYVENSYSSIPSEMNHASDPLRMARALLLDTIASTKQLVSAEESRDSWRTTTRLVLALHQEMARSFTQSPRTSLAIIDVRVLAYALEIIDEWMISLER